MDTKYVIGCLINKSSERLNLTSIADLAECLRLYYRTTYNELAFISEENGKKRQRVLKYTPTNLAKLHKTTGEISSVSFITFADPVAKDHQNPILDVDVLSLVRYVSDPFKLKVIIDASVIQQGFTKTLADMFGMITDHGFELESAVAFTMDKSKMPMFFLSGIETSGLTKEEAEIAHSLTRNIRGYRRKIWDVFSYNLVKKQLLRPELVSEITDIVTPGNIIELGDKYIISLGDDGKDGAEAELRRERLRKLFQREDLIMYRKY